MSAEEVDAWSGFFTDMNPAARRDEREKRAQKERASQHSEKQRDRGGVRTAQINYRCTPEFLKKVKAMQEFKQPWRSMADVLEQALDLLAEREGFHG